MEKEALLEFFRLNSVLVVSPGILNYHKYEQHRVEILGLSLSLLLGIC